jgi:hypothetical protein
MSPFPSFKKRQVIGVPLALPHHGHGYTSKFRQVLPTEIVKKMQTSA